MEQSEHTPYCIALQPICDRRLHHVADKLLYRSHCGADAASFDDPFLATVRSYSTAIYEVGLENLVGERMLLFTAPSEWIENGGFFELPAEQVFAELGVDAFASPKALEAIERLRSIGYLIAVPQTVFEQYPETPIELVDLIKIDSRRPNCLDLAARFKGQGPRLLATFVEDQATLDRVHGAAFDWFMGFVFLPPMHVKESGRQRRSNRAVELRLLAELTQRDLQFEQLEALLAQHPHFCVLLFAQVNSAAFSRGNRRIESLHEAVVRLGLERIKTMAMFLLLSRNDPIEAVQVRMLLNRAAMAARIAQRVRSIEPQTAFTLGLFSRLDAFEGLPMPQLLQGMPFSVPVQDALLERAGEMGKLLEVLDAHESGDLSRLSPAVVARLNEDFVHALAWTERWLVGEPSPPSV
jgi:EAL and modified HD-GYP domain-containing signal transduction protein